MRISTLRIFLFFYLSFCLSSLFSHLDYLWNKKYEITKFETPVLKGQKPLYIPITKLFTVALVFFPAFEMSTAHISHSNQRVALLTILIFSACFLIVILESYYLNDSLSSITLPSRFSIPHTTQQAPPNCSSTFPESYPLQPLLDDDPEFLKTYVKWHAEKRKCLADPSCKEKPKVLVARCPMRHECLGVGDRIRGVYFAFWLAIATERVLFIDWSQNPYWLQIGMIPASLDWTIPSTIPLNSSWPYLDWNMRCIAFKVCIRAIPFETKVFSYDGTEINFLTDDIGKKLGDTQLLSMYSRFDYSSVDWLARNPLYADKFGKYVKTRKANSLSRSPMIRCLFRPSPQTVAKMSSIAFNENEPYYAMHVRSGDAVDEGTLDRFSSMTEKGDIIAKNMVICLDMIRNSTDGPKRVFIASDSDKLKEYTTTLFEKRGYEVRTYKDTVVHLGQLYWISKVVPNLVSKKMCNAFLSVYADLFMLAGARQIVGSGSHFSTFAGMLIERTKLIHIKPQNEKVVERKCVP